MIREEAMSLAWIALDGLLLRNFFSTDEYDSDTFDETVFDAFRWYHKLLRKSETVSTDLFLLLHIQNLAENEMRSGTARFKDITPVGLAKDIMETAAADRWRGMEYDVFKASLPAVLAYDRAPE